ncbi:Aldo/keto reductase [Exidia glandulosa HHB12029]|uniref:Aldo/keto reductase n=1 Tax=Exidia glandulosa HHB12029 TaxID=1314781 RepID=A0A165EN52_EXIGL|nr:Aldo/keto reductase [Exidia glandulosa HHB12029]
MAVQSLRGQTPSVEHSRPSSKLHVPITSLPTTSLGPLACPRLFLGLWQLSSPNWGSAPEHRINEALSESALRGFTAFDMADHYGDAEVIFGNFRSNVAVSQRVTSATKWCVFKPMVVTRQAVEAAVEERLARLRLQAASVDLLQFHWQNYDDKGYLDALHHLLALRDEGKIRAIGLCNFDTEHLIEVCEALPPGSIVSNQVQFSLIDTRPLHGMCAACVKHGVKLLTYGTLCGGLLADHYLGASQPSPYASDFTPSLRKYLDMVNVWGTWDHFQLLLRTLHDIAQRHGHSVSIANVATRWVLEQDAVGAVIIGARLGVSSNLTDNSRVFQWDMTEQDKADISAVVTPEKQHRMLEFLGDCGAEYR